VIVVDASVAVKWFLAEEGTPQANALLNGKEKLLAPELIDIEVTAGITRRFRTGELAEEAVREGLRDWAYMLSEGLMTLVPHKDEFQAAIDLTFKLKHPFQDCLYLALAERLNAPLITADPKFIERSKGLAAKVRPLLGPSGRA